MMVLDKPKPKVTNAKAKDKPSPLTMDEQAISLLISSRAGFIVYAVGELLSVYQLELATKDGERFGVELFNFDGDSIDERLFRRAEEAARFFETQRNRLRMGFEYGSIS